MKASLPTVCSASKVLYESLSKSFRVWFALVSLLSTSLPYSAVAQTSPTTNSAPTQTTSSTVEPTSNQKTNSADSKLLIERFEKDVRNVLSTHCYQCHNQDQSEAGVRVDQLDGSLSEKNAKHWESIQRQVQSNKMPPEDEPTLSKNAREKLLQWIEDGLHEVRSRDVARNGSMRRLTVAQYRNTLRDLLGIEENLTSILPPDAVSKDGFTNNAQTLALSPIHIEAFFQIAERAVDLALVDETIQPTVQNFRMDLGKGINTKPCPDKLVLGANNLLLANDDFVVTELSPSKSFPYKPFAMQRKFRFIEGYQGNDTVRGWRDFESIYHAVFACMRGSEGYPKGRPYETVERGLLLRPAIPSSEIFGESNTYGPHANFKISLRELPEHGKFRIKVRAAKYDDGILLDRNTPAENMERPADYTIDGDFSKPHPIDVAQTGIYQVEVYQGRGVEPREKVDHSQLDQGLVATWDFDSGLKNSRGATELVAQPVETVRTVDSPFGKAISLDGYSNWLTVPKNAELNLGSGDFTVAAWIHPKELRQAGIVCLGGYGYRHGWILDMPTSTGVLRLETANRDRKHNGTVQSPAGVIKVNQWQHVAAVINRSEQVARLYVNGYEVAQSPIENADLFNPEVDLQIGRVLDAEKFAGEIDEVFLSRRALAVDELQLLVEPGRAFANPPFPPGMNELNLHLGVRSFTGPLTQAPFLAVRLPAGPLTVRANSIASEPLIRVALRKLDDDSNLAKRFMAFEKRSPELGVHLGLRRDCGSTMNPVGVPQRVSETESKDFYFEGAIANFPSPDVEKDNVNYLAGIREIGVRSEYTDSRDMPRLLIQSVEFEGPYFDAWPPASHRRIMDSTIDKSQTEPYARDVIERFAARAFRRPLTDTEKKELNSVWKSSFSTSGDLRSSISDTLIAVLTSPQFLFLIETSRGPEAEDLDEFELASKLSYFLWNLPPDKQLLELAEASQLHTQLDAQVDRLIADPKFANFTSQFVSQWLSLEKMEIVETDSKRFPKMTRTTKAELQKEPIEFMQYLFRENLPVRNLVRSDFLVLNDVVASYYGLGEATENGLTFTPWKASNTSLGGLLTQPAILAGLTDGRESNPVKRGAWFARRMIAMPPDDPPPNVPKLEDLTQLSMRERLERHRNVKGCAECHMGIDPWGVPFEEFDAGGLRKLQKVDSRSKLPTGEELSDFEQFRNNLESQMLNQVAFSVTKHLTAYAIGRSLTYNEHYQLREKIAAANAEELRLRDLIHQVIHSDPFLKK